MNWVERCLHCEYTTLTYKLVHVYPHRIYIHNVSVLQISKLVMNADLIWLQGIKLQYTLPLKPAPLYSLILLMSWQPVTINRMQKYQKNTKIPSAFRWGLLVHIKQLSELRARQQTLRCPGDEIKVCVCQYKCNLRWGHWGHVPTTFWNGQFCPHHTPHRGRSPNVCFFIWKKCPHHFSKQSDALVCQYKWNFRLLTTHPSFDRELVCSPKDGRRSASLATGSSPLASWAARRPHVEMIRDPGEDGDPSVGPTPESRWSESSSDSRQVPGMEQSGSPS